MDLVEALAACPPLLKACVRGERRRLGKLRLVSKQCGDAALTAHIHSHVLQLNAPGIGDMAGIEARAGRLLSGTTLSHLIVFIMTKGETFRPPEDVESSWGPRNEASSIRIRRG